MNLDLLTAFSLGLFGSGHCLGMCGGIAGILSVSQQSPSPAPWQSMLNRSSAYNLGRLFSYALIGGLFGTAVASMADLMQIRTPLVYLRLFSAIFLILLACYLGRWWMGLTYLEKLGQGVWRKLAPLRAKLLPIENTKQAFGLGMVWGWLPCGLVYSALAWSASSGSFGAGALTMLSFGLGTLPMMLAVGVGADKLKALLNHSLFRQGVAVSLLLYAAYLVMMSWHMLSKMAH